MSTQHEQDLVTTASDQENAELCSACGGFCCTLYLASDENGDYIGADWLPGEIDLWQARLTLSGALVADAAGCHAGVAGVAPLHDPRRSQPPSPASMAYRATLPAWVDVSKCQFCHPDTGCLLPRHFRPPICGDYTCEQWPATLAGDLSLLDLRGS